MRPLTPADAPAVAALIRTAFAAQSVVTDPPASALRVQPEAIRAHLAQGGGGAVIDGPAGPRAALLWTPRDGALHVSRLAVAPDARRQGLARHLLTAAEAAARAAALPALTLETRLVLADNRRLFASAGFQEVSRHAHPGYAHPTFVLMRKPLPGCQDAMGSAGDRA